MFKAVILSDNPALLMKTRDLLVGNAAVLENNDALPRLSAARLGVP